MPFRPDIDAQQFSRDDSEVQVSRRQVLRGLFLSVAGAATTYSVSSFSNLTAAQAVAAKPVTPGSFEIPILPLGKRTGAPEDAGEDNISLPGQGASENNRGVGIVPVDDFPTAYDFPFAHGVASGDPLQDRVIIWTRVTLAERDPDGAPGANPKGMRIPVDWSVATDREMSNVVVSGTQEAIAEHDWTIKVDVTGLATGETYYYQFVSQGKKSVIGRTRTAFGAGIDEMRMAVMSCSSYWSSWWSGLSHLANRNDLDLVVHLGDYLYDFIDKDEMVRSRPGFDKLDHPDNRDWLNLDEVRRRYALWRSDESFARAHQQHPWTIIWDNHDIDPFYGNQVDVPEISIAETVTISDTFRAFWEWTPTRPPRGDGSGEFMLVEDFSYPVPENPALVYRKLQFGDLVDIHAMDAQSLLPKYELPVDNSHLDGAPSLLGRPQFEWLEKGLADSQARGVRWKVLAQQAWFSPTELPDVIPGQEGPKFGLSRWSDYLAEKEKLIALLRDGINNAVMVSGDAHGNLGSDLLSQSVVGDGYISGLPGTNPRPGAEPGNVQAGALRTTTGNSGTFNARRYSAGVEFCPTSMGRGGADDAVRGVTSAVSGNTPEARMAAFAASRVAEMALLNLNSNVQFMEWSDHGYGIVHFDRQKAIFEFWWQDKYERNAPDILGHQMVSWADEDFEHPVPRYPNQIDSVTLHGLPVEATQGSRVSESA